MGDDTGRRLNGQNGQIEEAHDRLFEQMPDADRGQGEMRIAEVVAHLMEELGQPVPDGDNPI